MRRLIHAVFGRRRRRRAEAWAGTVAGKSRASPDGQNLYHYVQITLTDGQSKRIRVRRKLWKVISVGDEMSKRPGEYHPTRL